MDAADAGGLAPRVPGSGVTGLLWKVNRLRAMGAREIVHRTWRWGVLRLEARRVTAGKSPSPTEQVGPGEALFPPAEELGKLWHERYRLDESGLTDLLRGRIGFFGHNPLDVGEPVQWNRCPLTGVVAPRTFGKSIDYRDDSLVGNVKFLWELGRHQHLVPLAAAYAVSGHRTYAAAAVAQIEGWIAANPYGLGIHWCSALEVALRLISWALVHGLITSREGPDGLFALAADRSRIGRSIYQQAAFVRGFLSRYSSANNHLIGELTGLLVACRAFDLGAKGRQWASFAHAELESEAARQVFEDGVDREQAVYYHLWVLEYLLFAWIFEERIGKPFSDGYRQRLKLMSGFIQDIRPPNGPPPQIGDADDGMVARFDPAWPADAFNEVTAAAEAVLEGQAADPLPQKAFWYYAMAGKTGLRTTATAVSPPAYPRVYRDGGYAILGGAALHLVYDAGSLGYPSIAAHGHADALSVCLAVDGRWWLVDPGTYAYHSEPQWRNYFRGTSAHNTLRVDGVDQSAIGGPFLWTRHANAALIRCETMDDGTQVTEGWQDGYRKLGMMHRRTVLCDPAAGNIEIHDALEGQGTHSCELYFHFAPGLEVLLSADGGQAIASADGSRRRLRFGLARGWQWRLASGLTRPPLGWYSPALETKVPARVLVGQATISPPTSVITRIALL